ncbi:MAG: histidine phosphatase family protein [Rhodospirillales bacterium]|nr:histidine phosphatase family protein [Rhodospirillales bacterium]
MILLRHDQSEFNLHFTATRRDPGIVDARLTELGHAQARAAAEQLGGEPIARIVVSPYTRALQTAAPIAARLGIDVLINPLVRERCAFACDIGTPRTELARQWPHDFSGIEEVWWPPMPEPAEAVLDRAALFRAEMAALADWSNTLVVTHWGFIMALTGLSIQNGETLRFDPLAPPPETIPWRH